MLSRFTGSVSTCALAGFFVVGCSSVDIANSPGTRAPTLRAALERAALGPTVRVPVAPEIKTIGCAVVGTRDGITQAVNLPRSEVTKFVGALDSIDAPIIGGQPTRGALHVLTGRLRLRNNSNVFVINCLAPMTTTQRAFELKIKSSISELASSAFARLSVHANPARKSDVGLASEILLASLDNTPRGSRSLANLSGISPPTTGPRFDEVPCGTFESGRACGVPIIYGEVHAPAPPLPVIVDLSMLHDDRGILSLSDLMGFNYYGSVVCANASETWLALNTEMQQLEQEANDLEAATNAVANLTCQREYTEDGAAVCIDLFIQGKTAFMLEGDGRPPDPNAPVTASRGQMYINPATCLVRYVINTTRTVTVGPLGGGTYAPHKLNRVEAHHNPEGECVVEWKLLNGYCDEFNAGPGECPAIDGTIRFRPDGQGGWTADITEDKFPSRGIYKWNGSSFTKISEREGSIWLDLMTNRKNVERIRIERDNSLPPTCSLQ
jgi:hypothetical protein